MLSDFLTDLKKQKNCATVHNPYLDETIVTNLRYYLEYMCSIEGKRILLIGEAPGYKGCRITGIPFTSGKVIMGVDHKLFVGLRHKITLHSIESENSATIVWDFLRTRQTTPLFWNSFPYHPHPRGNQRKNRPPSKGEISAGIGFLKLLYSLFQPERVAGIGKCGVKCGQAAFPHLDIKYIRHPSHGGKKEFIRGMKKVLG